MRTWVRGYSGACKCLTADKFLVLIEESAASSMASLLAYPELDISNHSVDDVAMKLYIVYPDEAPRDFVPLSVCGDGNCLFRAASLVATGNRSMASFISLS